MKSRSQRADYKNIILVMKAKPNFKKLRELFLVTSLENLDMIRISKNILTIFEAFALGK